MVTRWRARCGRAVLVGAACVAALSCGGGGPREVPTSRTEAQTKCDELMGHWCARALDCAVSEGVLHESERAHQVSICVDVAGGTCDRAVGITESYDECSADMDTLDCPTLAAELEANDSAAMPASCDGVILI